MLSKFRNFHNLLLSSDRLSVLVHGHNFNLDSHIILTQPRHSNTSPDRLMVRHPLLEVADHCIQGFIVDRDMVRIDPHHLRPALTASMTEIELTIIECLIDLSVDFLVEFAGLGIPATFWGETRQLRVISCKKIVLPWPAHSIRSPMRTAWLYQNFF